MKSTPKVSVIIPVYGVEKYIERCARSLFEQSLDDIEYLFIDDCSPDESIAILKRTLEDYPHRKRQVVIHRMERNSGQAAVRKWGMANATGEYVTHCDSDDWVDADMYLLLYNKGKNDNLDYVVCNYYITDGLAKKQVIQDFSTDKLKMMFSFYTLWCKIFKRSLLVDNEIICPVGNLGEDRVYTAQLAWYAKSYGYVDKPLYYYYTNTNSIVHTADKERSISLFYQRKGNTDIICKFVLSTNIKGCKFYLTPLKLQALERLYSFIGDKSVYLLLKETYPELLKDCILYNRYCKRESVIYYLAYSRMYLILKSIIRRV